MKKARTLLILGIWISILSYLGFPVSWRDILFTITGLILIILSYSLYKEYKKKNNKVTENNFDNFSENKFFSERQDENENNFN